MDTPSELIAEWTEPIQVKNISTLNPLIVVVVAAILAVLLIALGYFNHDVTYYLAGLVPIAAAASWFTRQKRSSAPLHIKLTLSGIIVGHKKYPLDELGGFWIQRENGLVIINVEPKKAAAFPITLIYATDNADEAHSLFITILPEVEPRTPSLADSVGKYIRF